MSALKINDQVYIPNRLHRSGIRKTATIFFISECGRYCKIRWLDNSKNAKRMFKESPYPIDVLEKVEQGPESVICK